MFCRNCGKEIDVSVKFCPFCGASQDMDKKESYLQKNIQVGENSSARRSEVSSKNRLIAALLAFFLGWLGVHRFYVGKVGTGILQILTCWCLIGEVWALIDFIFIICGKFKDKDGRIISEWNV